MRARQINKTASEAPIDTYKGRSLERSFECQELTGFAQLNVAWTNPMYFKKKQYHSLAANVGVANKYEITQTSSITYVHIPLKLTATSELIYSVCPMNLVETVLWVVNKQSKEALRPVVMARVLPPRPSQGTHRTGRLTYIPSPRVREICHTSTHLETI